MIFSSAPHGALQSLAARGGAGAVAHGGAACPDALNAACAEGLHDGGRGPFSSHFPQKEELLLGFFDQ